VTRSSLHLPLINNVIHRLLLLNQPAIASGLEPHKSPHLKIEVLLKAELYNEALTFLNYFPLLQESDEVLLEDLVALVAEQLHYRKLVSNVALRFPYSPVLRDKMEQSLGQLNPGYRVAFRLAR